MLQNTSLRLLSWNVNGIRAAVKKNFSESVLSTLANIVCLQEVRARPVDFSFEIGAPSIASTFQRQLWNPAVKKGYSGTMILASEEHANDHIPGLESMDCVEGRVQTVNLGFATLLNVYTPNTGRELVRLEYRMKWDRAFLEYVKELQKVRPVIICGDLNVAHNEIDLARPKANLRSAGFTIEERNGFSALVQEAELIDSFRYLNGNVPGQYTWWSNMGRAREQNIGWRIDYFLIDRRLSHKLKEAYICPHIMGSDHCPVGIVLDLD